MTRKLISRLGATAVLAIGLCAATSAAQAQSQPLRLGTATEGGVWFVLGNGLAEVIGESLGTTVTPVTTAGSMENARRIAAGGDLQLGLSVATSMRGAIDDGTVDPAKVRILGAGHGNFTQVVVRKDSGWSNWSEAFEPGRTIGVGEPGSAAYEMATGVIEAEGVSLDEIKPARLGHQAQADALKNRDIQVMVVSPGIPTAAVVDVMSTANGSLLSATDEELQKALDAMPFMSRGVIPANTYDNQPEDVVTVKLPSLLIASADLTDEQAYEAVKAVYSKTDRLTAVHSNGAQWTLDNALASRDFLEKLGFEYHPGAQRYYEEQGIW